MPLRTPSWWPPKAGDKLRHFTHRSIDGHYTHVHALIHVIAVFDHNGETLATVAEWLPGRRRWLYSTIQGWLEAETSYWPDGQDPPRRHGSPGHWCDCCA